MSGATIASEYRTEGRKATWFELFFDLVFVVAVAQLSGAYAQYALMDAREAIPVPPSLSWEEAAATPITFCVVYDMLVEQGRLRAGERLLIMGVSSGVGVAALQAGKALGATVLGIVLGLIVAVARLSPVRPFRLAAEGYVEVIRNTPALVQVFIIYYGLGQLGIRLPAPVGGSQQHQQAAGTQGPGQGAEGLRVEQQRGEPRLARQRGAARERRRRSGVGSPREEPGRPWSMGRSN